MKRGPWIGVLMALALVAGGIGLLRQTAVPSIETAVRRVTVERLGPVGPDAPSPDDNGLTRLENGAYISEPVAPVIVDLADLPPDAAGPGQYERWVAGEIDLDEARELIPPAERQALQAQAQRLSAAGLVQQIEPFGPAAVFGFDSLHFNDHPSATFVPPDPELAVGSDHIIAVVNTIFEVYNKSGGTLAGPVSFSSFFNLLPNCSTGPIGPFDPNVLYDESSDRYLLGVDVDGSHYCLAVSVTDDPTGSWYLYEFFTGVNNTFFDYPHAGVGRDAIYVGANQFSNSTNAFVEGRVWAFDKANLYAGQPVSTKTRSLTAQFDTPQPANLHGFAQGTWPPGGPHYIMSEVGNGNDYVLFAWEAPFGADVLSNIASFNLTAASGVAAGFPVDAPQQGSSNRLQANDFRPLDFEYRNGRLWTTMTISCNPGGGTVNCIRWAEIDPAGPSLVQAGVFASGGEHRIFPDLAVDRHGNMAVGYTKTSSSGYPAVWAACRGASWPGGVNGEIQLKAGEAPYQAYDSPPYRWGDYSGMTIDPDGERFWYLGQYSKSLPNAFANWGTRISSFRYSDCPNSVTFTDFNYLPSVLRP